MNKIKAILISLILFLLAAQASALSPKMFYAEYRYIHPEIKERSYEGTTRKLWRVGFKYLRLEEAPDPIQNIHGIIISNAPDHYMINKYTMSGQHTVDRAEPTIHASVFLSPELPKEVQDLEMGHENAFFLKHEALKIGSETMDAVECDVYSITVKDVTLTLHKRKDNGNPFQVGIEQNGEGYKVRYLKYEQNLPPDFKLFEVPQGVKIIDAN